LDGNDASSFLGVNDKAADADKLDGKDSSEFLTAPTPWEGYTFIPAPSSAGGKSCVALNLPAGPNADLKTGPASTYTHTSTVAYLRYFVKEASSTSRIVAQRIVTTSVGNDPVANTRSAVFNLDTHIHGGNVFDVQLGQIHSMNACIQSSTGQSATA